MAAAHAVGTRVRAAGYGRRFVGVVTKVKTCTVLRRRVKLYAVRWDGDPQSFPVNWKDEAGTGRFAGYEATDLVPVRGGR